MKIKNTIIIALIAIVGAAFAFTSSATVQAINVFPECGELKSTVCSGTTDTLFGPGGFWNRILETFTFIIGAIAVLMIIIGGIRYTVSNGDQSQITSAKNTILYAIVGLVVAVLAYAIVHFVLTNL